MTGENLYTHQLPRVGREARPVVVAAHPELAAAIAEAEQVSPDNWHLWLALWLDRYGPTIEITKFTADSHEWIDPLSELAEFISSDRIIVVDPHEKG
jgi:hypothetical protein